MTGRTSRRALLVALAATAGCTGQGDSENGPGAGTGTPAGTLGTPASATDAPTETEAEATESGPGTETPGPVEVREWPESYYRGPLVSTHEHMFGRDGSNRSADEIDWLVRWMDRNRVARMTLFTADPLLSRLEGHLDRIVPFAAAVRPEMEDRDRIADAFEARLTDHSEYEGIGEIGLGDPTGDGNGPLPPDHPAMLDVYDLAAERDVPVMIHPPTLQYYSEETRSEWDSVRDIPAPEQLENAYAHNRDATFLVHHGYYDGDGWGDVSLPETLDRHPNLYYDVSGVNAYAYSEGYPQRSREWFEERMAEAGVEHFAERHYEENETVLTEYSDRVTWGMDAGMEWHYTEWALDAWIDVGRSLLGRLSEEDARNVGYRTAEEVLGVEVDAEA